MSRGGEYPHCFSPWSTGERECVQMCACAKGGGKKIHTISIYLIALNLRGSKFSWIAIFEDFSEIISRIHCMCMPHTYILWAWHTSLAGLSNMHRTVTLSSTRARNCQQSNAYFEGISLERVPCGFGSLAQGCCPSMLLQSEHENCVVCQNFSLKYFRKQLQNSRN